MTDAQVIARGHRAASEYAELEGAFAAVRSALLETIVATPLTQPEKVLRLHAAASNLEALKLALHNVIDSGTLTEEAARNALAMSGLTRP